MWEQIIDFQCEDSLLAWGSSHVEVNEPREFDSTCAGAFIFVSYVHSNYIMALTRMGVYEEDIAKVSIAKLQPFWKGTWLLE